MVSVKLVGQMGNQMFQIAAAIGYAKKHNMSFHIPNRTENEKVWPMALKWMGSGPVPMPGSVIWHEPSHAYTEIPKHDNIILSGYFQSEKYFLHARQLIFDAFGFQNKTFVGLVSIHVRRGDYLRFPNKHPVVTLDYIQQAIEYFNKKGYKRFLVFSDDIRWCKENFKFAGNHFEYSAGLSPLDDMAKMMICEHHIISNSTFSWWAAWLNQNPHKIIVSPSKENWFGPGNKHLNTDDLIPDSWIQIKYK